MEYKEMRCSRAELQYWVSELASRGNQDIQFLKDQFGHQWTIKYR